MRPSSRVTSRGDEPPVDRLEAGRWLRQARAGGAEREERIEWAFSAMPESPGARRLKIELLLRYGDTESAKAIIGQGLLRRPTDPGLSLLRARCLFAEGKIESAHRELRLVLVKRPQHRGALELGGKIALRLDDAERAAYLFRCADARQPQDRIKALRITSLLRLGRPDLAHGVLERMEVPPPLLRARILWAQGRLLEATETLLAASRDGADPTPVAVTCALIDLLEETGDAERLGEVLERIGTDQPAVLARAGTAWLGLGSFGRAVVRMTPLARVPGYRGAALTVILVAAAMINRSSLAARALRRLRRIDEPVDRRAVAAAWCHGLLGRNILDRQSTPKTGSDPHTGRLEDLVREAAAVFDEEIATAVSGPERSQLEAQRDRCRALIVQFSGPLLTHRAA